MIPGTRTFNRFNPKDNGKVCCWVLSGMSTSSDFDINTVHHDDTNDAAEDHIVENIVRQPINVGQWMLVTYENNQFPGEILSTSATHAVVKDMEKFGGFFHWPRTDDILPYPFEDITKTLEPPQPCSVQVDIIHLLDYTIKTVVLHL